MLIYIFKVNEVLVLEVGIDLIKIERFQNRSDDFKKRILSFAELEFLKDLSSIKASEFIASRFALKEAFFKATQKNIPFSKISYLNNEILINGKIDKTLKASISHSKDAVVAIVLKLV